MMLLAQPNTLSEQQCRELDAFKTSTNEVKLYRRAKVILYRNAGYTPDEIEEHTEYSEREQRYLVRRYREDGVKGLYDRPRSGRPKHSPDQRSGGVDVHDDDSQTIAPELPHHVNQGTKSDTIAEPEATQDVEPTEQSSPRRYPFGPV